MEYTPLSASHPDALKDFKTIEAILRGKTPALFLDYDGTLVPLARRPELATASDELRAAIARLAVLMPVAVVSGRGRADVMQILGVSGIAYAGSHGFDITDANGRDLSGDIGAPYVPALRKAAASLTARLAPVAGAFVEDKKYALAIHFREVTPRDQARVADIVESEVNRHPTLRRTGGKMIHELRPALEWNKGTAVVHIMKALGLATANTLPVYIGDDETDEDAFRAVHDTGIGIKVGTDNTPTAARYSLETPKDVNTFVGQLADLYEPR